MSTHSTSQKLRAGERLVSMAAVGVRCAEYLGHDSAGTARTLDHAISRLRVRAVGSSEVPIFHPTHGIYGFRRLSPGTHRIHIEDPQGRFLPRAVQVTVDARIAQWRQALERGQRPDWSGWEPVVGVPVYPSAGRHVPPAETAVVGDVVVNGVQLAFARVEIDAPSGGKIVTYTDRGGTYLAWLRQERSEVDTAGAGSTRRTFTRRVRAFRLRDGAPSGVELGAFPVDFDANANPTFWEPLSLSADQVQFDIGQTRRFYIHIP